MGQVEEDIFKQEDDVFNEIQHDDVYNETHVSVVGTSGLVVGGLAAT